MVSARPRGSSHRRGVDSASKPLSGASLHGRGHARQEVQGLGATGRYSPSESFSPPTFSQRRLRSTSSASSFSASLRRVPLHPSTPVVAGRRFTPSYTTAYHFLSLLLDGAAHQRPLRIDPIGEDLADAEAGDP